MSASISSRLSFPFHVTRKIMVNCNVFHDYGTQNIVVVSIGLVIHFVWFVYLIFFICSRFVRV